MAASSFADVLARHSLRDGTFRTPLPGVWLTRSSEPTMPMPVVYEPTACFVAQGRKRVMLGTTAYEYFPGTHIVASVSVPVIGQVIEASPAAPHLSVQLDLDVRELSELAVHHPAPRDARPPGPAGLTLHRTNPALADAVARLVSLLDTPDDIEALAPLTTREILYRLLVEPDVDVVRQMAHADSRLSQVSRAIVWIRAHFAEPVRIEEAAAHAGMSRSTFHLTTGCPAASSVVHSCRPRSPKDSGSTRLRSTSST